MPRLVWKLRDPGPAAAGGLLAAEARDRTHPNDLLREGVHFLVPPRPVAGRDWPEAQPFDHSLLRDDPHLPVSLVSPDLYHAIPRDLDEGRKGLGLLRSFPLEVEDVVLELEVSPPKPAKGPFPTQCSGSPYHVGPTPDWSPCQRYLDPLPGLDVRHAWDFAGGRGQDVVLLDLEIGYNPNHEELGHVEPQTSGFPDNPHGSMSLGVCCADGSDAVGIRGIAHEAEACFASVERDLDLGVRYPLVHDALLDCLGDLPPGSVVLVELQAKYDGPDGRSRWLPIERSPEIRRLMEMAAEKPVYIVEPAGNGDVDLDAEGLKARAAAIMVGGGKPRSRTRWWRGDGASNYGSRIDVQGWAEEVVTVGAPGSWEDDLQSVNGTDRANRCYTQSFNGTSSAAAMVAGAVACLSGILNANGVDPIPLDEMRDLLRCTGTPQGPGDHIGPLPDLRKAIAELQERFGPLRAASDAAA